MNKFNSGSSYENSWDLAQDQSKMLSLFGEAKVCYQSLNKEGIVVEVNDHWLKTLGYLKEEIIGKQFGDFLSEDSKVLFAENFKTICSAKKLESSDLKIVCKDGNSVIASITGLGSFDEEDQIIRTHCIWQSPKEHIQVENSKYSEILKSSATVVEVSYTGIIETVSSSRELFSGFEPDEMIRKHFLKTGIFPVDQAALLKTIYKNILKGEIPTEVIEFRWRHKNGELGFGKALFNIVREKGDKKKIQVFLFDVTDKKSLEFELNQSIEFRKKLYAILAHDLRTPFNSMLGFFDLLQNNYDSLTDDKRRSYINLLKLSANKAYELLESVLLWSRDAEINKQNQGESCKLKDIIDDIDILNNAKLKSKNIQIIQDFDSKSCIIADKNMLSAILRNLISNAIKFSYSNSQIHISLEKSEKNYIISIKDYGVGMDLSKMKSGEDLKINGTKSGTSGEMGSGLGLGFVKEFVQRSSGKIWFESEPEKGTTVFVQLPNCKQ